MLRRSWSVVMAVVLSAVSLYAQVDKIVIPAGTPEDQALQTVSSEPDAQKKLALYEDFVQKFSSNPAAVAYGNWQIAQHYQSAGDLQKALDYGDKALAASPRNLEILVSQTGIAQQMKDNGKTLDYACRGGEVYNSLGKSPKPEGMSDQDFATQVEDTKSAMANSYQFLEAAAFNAIAAETDAQQRMSYIERYAPAFPKSQYDEQITSYAMVSLSELKDTKRLVAYGEKTLETNPDSLPALLLLANAYSEDSKPGSSAKAVTYAQKAITLAKADAPDADRSRKLSAGAAHSTVGYVYLKQEKTTAAIPELKAATALLKGQDDQSFAVAAYRLGFAYAKLNRVTEAREVLMEAVKIPGPLQAMSQELLLKVNAARAGKK